MRVLLYLLCLLMSCTACHSYRFPAYMEEVSGCTEVEDGYWWLEDGGNEAALYKTNHKAKVLSVKELPMLQNRDWEALSANDQQFFIGDFGNNKNRRKDLRIYIVDKKSKAVDSILFAYPDQKAFPPMPKSFWNFDCEGMFYRNDSLHLFSKNRFSGNFYTKYYRMPAQAGTQVPELIDSIFLEKGVVTDAVYIPQRQEIALLTYWGSARKVPQTKGAIFILEQKNGKLSVKKRIKLRKFLVIRQYETIALDADGHFVLSNERKAWQRHKLRRIKYKKAGTMRP